MASVLANIEKKNREFEDLLSNLFIQKVVEFKDLEIGEDSSAQSVLLVYIPYPCLKVMRNAHEQLVPELEKPVEEGGLGKKVLLTAARKI